jgi:mercuric ion transport protein
VNSRPEEQQQQQGSAPALALAGLAALLASTCCVVPLVFAIVGISGVWIGQLRRVEPYSYPLTALATLSLLIAAWRIWRPMMQQGAQQCDIDECRARNASARRWFWVLAALTLLPIVVREGAHFFY